MGAALNPLFRSTVRGAYKMGRKTKEMLAEAHEQVNDIVAEVHAGLRHLAPRQWILARITARNAQHSPLTAAATHQIGFNN